VKPFLYAKIESGWHRHQRPLPRWAAPQPALGALRWAPLGGACAHACPQE